MHFIIQLVVNAVVLLIAAYILPKVEIKNFMNALLVAFLIGIVGGIIGWLIRGGLHVATLGLFYLFGLSFIIRLVANAIIIKIVDAMVPGFKVHGFGQAILLSLIISIIGALVDHLLGSNDNTSYLMEHVRMLAA
jgi:putative membrane protein